METGYMTTSYETHIGIWKYYSSTGKLDSIVNHDKNKKVSFCEFYQICKERGLTGRYSYISFNSVTKVWRIEKKTYGQTHPTGVGIELQDDTNAIKEFSTAGYY